MSEFPWEHSRYTKYYAANTWYGNSFTYRRTWMTVRDNDKLNMRKGDLFQIKDGIINKPNDWKTWFLTEEDYEKYIVYDSKIPSYCRNQWAIVLNRYRVEKLKNGRKYYDYGTINLILTGPKRGTIKRFFISVPWKRYLSLENITFAYDRSWLAIVRNNMVEPIKIANTTLYYKSLNINRFINENKITRDNEKSIDVFLEKIYNLARDE